ncbi:MAG: autotransporter-associated beta strand repeat-containing protein [Thermoguttaceae bacterium]
MFKRTTTAAVLVGSLLCLVGPAQAVICTFKPVDGDFNVATNWSATPAAGFSAYISDSKTARLTGDPLWQPNYLEVGGSTPGYLYMIGGTLTPTYVNVGYANSGSIVTLTSGAVFSTRQSGNKNMIGYGAGAQGTLTIDNSTFQAAETQPTIIGSGGLNGSSSGTVIIRNGGIMNGYTLYLGGSPGYTAGSSAGALTLDANANNRLTMTSNIYVSHGSTGSSSITQDGGVVTAPGVILANLTGTNGAYTITGGTLATSAISMGSGIGTLSVSGGNVNMNNGTIGSLSDFAFSGGVLQNIATVAANVNLGASPVFQQDTGTSGAVTGALSDISGVAGTLTKTGGGELIVSGSCSYTGKTTVTAGTLQMALPAYSNLLSHTADIQGGQMVFDYANTTTPVADVRASLHSGAMYTSTGAAAGYVVGYNDDGISKVTAKVALLGDTDLGGIVNNDDLARLLSALGGTDCVWQQGDFNYDAKVNNDDLAMLLSNLGKTFAGFGGAKAQALGGAVPEPSTLVLLTVGLVSLIAYTWRKRK